MVRSKRKSNVNVGVPKIATDLTSCYCRKCQRNRHARDFYDATDTLLDTNGKMSVCRYCIKDVYELFYVKNTDIYDAIYQTCRILNVRYDTKSIESTLKNIQSNEENGKVVDQVFGIYLSKLKIAEFGHIDVDAEDFTFHEPSKYDTPFDSDNFAEGIGDQLVKFWGDGYSPDQYQFLEDKLDEYKKTHKSDTAAEVSLLRQICYTELDIREARKESKGVSTLVKMLQDLMKTASVDPSKANLANSGKTNDTFSSFIKTIEQNEPADYYEDRELFRDFDGIDSYYQNYVVRPIKNFITQSRDFSIAEEDDDPDADDLFDISDVGE